MYIMNFDRKTCRYHTVSIRINYLQVKRKNKHKEKSEDKKKVDVNKGEEREELDFQFDEELTDSLLTGRNNAFSEWSVEKSA